MIFISETFLHDHLSILIALKKIFGIGKFNSKKICKKLGFSLNLKLINLNLNQINKIEKIIKSLKLLINNELKVLLINQNFKLVKIKLFRGLRKLKGYPVRGQRTRTNAKTIKKLKNKY